MERNLDYSLAQERPEQLLHRLRNRTTPFFLIVLFSAAVSVLRIYLIPEFSLYTHFLLFVLQICTLTGIWFLINGLNRVLNKAMPFERGPLKRMGLQILLTLLVVAPVLILIIWKIAPKAPHFVSPQFIGIAAVLFVVLIFLFNFGFYAFYFFGNWQHSIMETARLQVQAAELEREKFDLQYHQLRNQVNPHFLFNTLTSLDALIQTDPDLASEFLQHLSKVYRYVLRHKETEVVRLQSELNFIDHYISLLRIRYKNALTIDIAVDEMSKEKGIVMVTLQMLIDNVVKHNIAQVDQPLFISITAREGFLSVKNNKQIRKQISHSTKQGLQQLKQLYSYLTPLAVQVLDAPESFEVKLPLL